MNEREKLDNWEKQGINVKAAMRYADDSMEFYEQLISIFLQEYEDKRAKIEREMNNPGGTYTVLVHGLKNSARYLGADKLADLAYEHEKASKTGNTEYIAENIGRLFEVWKATADIFRKENV